MIESTGRAEVGWDERLLFAPLNALSVRMRWLLTAVCTLLTMISSARLAYWMTPPFDLPDVGYYVDMAKGQVNLVPQPFSSRPLAPLIARGIAAAAHCSVQQAFVVLAYASVAVTAAVVFWLATRSAAPRGVLLAVAVVPFWGQLLHGYALPDPLYAALLACLLVALATDRAYVAAGLLLPLMVARESTSLTLVCLLLVAGKRLGWAGSALAVAATGAGALVTRWLAFGGRGNPEHLPQSLYLLGKVPWNLLRSGGLVPWSNLYPVLCRTPAWQHALHLGPVRTVGVCEWSAVSPAQAIAALLTTFGLLPTAAFALWRWRSEGRREDLLLRFCLLYGGVSFLIAPGLGTWYSRLFGYAWPLCLVAGPQLAGAVRRSCEQERGVVPGCFVLLIHLALCVLGDRWVTYGTLLLALGLHVIGFVVLRSQRETGLRAGATA